MISRSNIGLLKHRLIIKRVFCYSHSATFFSVLWRMLKKTFTTAKITGPNVFFGRRSLSVQPPCHTKLFTDLLVWMGSWCNRLLWMFQNEALEYLQGPAQQLGVTTQLLFYAQKCLLNLQHHASITAKRRLQAACGYQSGPFLALPYHALAKLYEFTCWERSVMNGVWLPNWGGAFSTA